MRVGAAPAQIRVRHPSWVSPGRQNALPQLRREESPSHRCPYPLSPLQRERELVRSEDLDGIYYDHLLPPIALSTALNRVLRKQRCKSPAHDVLRQMPFV
jgi:hypothetical protein